MLTGLDKIANNACEPNFKIESETDMGDYRQIRFYFDSEIGETVPCYILIPKLNKEKYPVAIVLQGHSTGFHLSIGENKYNARQEEVERKSLAVQAVKRGYVALAIEQRGMGERKPTTDLRWKDTMCRFASVVALHIGRTLVGERVWDVSKAIDVLSNFKEADVDKILITGNSGGGTISYYAACYDERIKLSVPSCSFCSYRESILDVIHCNCNYIPSAYCYFDMQDLSCLIAPRNLIAVAGITDDIFPINGVRRAFKTVQEVYAANGKAQNCTLIETPREHWWCADIVWNAIDAEIKKLGWV
jgi:cephalosporin-C deacetylase-like acetyl esterase